MSVRRASPQALRIGALASVVVVGGGYAGVLAANRIAGRLGSSVRVTLVTECPELVHRVRLHEVLVGTRLRRYPLRSVLHASVRTLAGRAAHIDGRAGECELVSGEKLHFDQLVLAAGSRIDDEVPGVREHAFALSGPDPALAFAAKLKALPSGSTVTVVGSGLTGVEVACEVAEAHPRLDVRLMGSELATSWPTALRELLRTEVEALGVAIELNVEAVGIEPDALLLSDGQRRTSQATVWTAGFRGSALGIASNFPVDSYGRVRVDEALRVEGQPSVVAAGDIAAPPLVCGGSGIAPLRMACATAIPMGAHAADVVIAQLAGAVPLRFRYRNTVQCVSLGRHRGLLVFIDQDDQPTGRVLAGRWGALAKEFICRAVIGTLRLERIFPGAYVWPGGGAREPIATPLRLTAGVSRHDARSRW
ncbi:MAG: NAD(P)/FAD-dependent oxidoreductase [Polyangiaceae bacterium]